MNLLRDILKELAGMFWADPRLNLGLFAVTALIGISSAAFSNAVMPILLTLGYGTVIVWALFPPMKGD